MNTEEFEKQLAQYTVEIADLEQQLQAVNEALVKKQAEERAAKKALKEEEKAKRKVARSAARAAAKESRKEKRKEIKEVFEEAHHNEVKEAAHLIVEKGITIKELKEVLKEEVL